MCARTKQLHAAERGCCSIGGGRLEKTILAELFTVLEPASLQATAKALAEAEDRHRQNLAAFELAAERARYEADRARRQYDQAEPENRLVTRTLERAWEDKLAAVRQAENDLRAQQARRPVALTEQELAWITAARADVKAVFWAPATTIPERTGQAGGPARYDAAASGPAWLGDGPAVAGLPAAAAARADLAWPPAAARVARDQCRRALTGRAGVDSRVRRRSR